MKEKIEKKVVVEKSEKMKLWRSIGILVLLLVLVFVYDLNNLSKIEQVNENFNSGVEGLMQKFPNFSIFVIGVLISLFSSLMMKLFLNQEHLKKLKKKQKDLQGRLKECQKKGDTCEMEKINSEMMEVSMDLMKSSFSMKQFIITFVPFLLLFTWLRRVYVDPAQIFTNGGFLLRYMVAVLVSSGVYKKIFNLA